jgi:hypothetical protein
VHSEPVIFAIDNRQEYGEVTDPKMLRVADATAALFDDDEVSCGGGICFLALLPFTEAFTDRGTKDLCDGVPFENQLAGANCSAFLVAPDLMATAGHCLDCDESGCPSCDGTEVVFGFTADADGDTSAVISDSDRYRCIGTPAGVLDGDDDWAIFQIDRPAEGRDPLIVNYSSTMFDDELMIVGHPEGLPLKLAKSGFIKDDSDPQYFSTNLDTFGGNSGSPVVDYRTGVVDGIHVRGPAPSYDAISDGFLSWCAVERVCSTVSGCDSIWAEETRFSLAAQQVPLHAALVMTAVF